MADETICANCREPKWRHTEFKGIDGEKSIFECHIVRDDCNKNYRFKKIKLNDGNQKSSEVDK